MALNLLLSVHGCVCLNLIKLSALARRELVHFPLAGSISEGGPWVCWVEEGSVDLGPQDFLWGAPLELPSDLECFWSLP